jgi:hypothetical protein
MGRFAHRFSTLAIVFLFGVSCAWAQQGQSQQGQSQQQTPAGQQPGGQNPASPQAPLPPLSQSQGQSGKQQQQPEQGQGQGATTGAQPLTGAEQYTLSSMGAGRSYAIPSFQFAQSVTTSGTGAFGTAEVDPVSTLSGLFAFHHLWSKYEFTTRYAGTGFIYNRQSELNTSAHELSISQRINGRRSSFLLSDVVTYMPESSFGYARFSGFSGYGSAGYGYGGLFGSSGGGLNTTFLPNQSILTGPSSRVGNSVVGVYDYQTSPLSSITLTGAYTMLRFPSSGFISNNDAIFRLGYNHTLTRKNSMGVSYQAGLFGFGSSSGDFTNHVISLTFRRTITERLGLQLGAGPQINVFSNSAPGQDTNASWQASAELSYQFRRSSLGFSYMHYTSGGSGVYLGAQTDYASLSYGLPLSRIWSIDSSLGYARNKTVQNGNLSGVGESYNSWYGSINVHRALNRSLSMFFGYNLQQQLAATPSCVGSTCGTFYTQQYFSFGLNWHPILPGVD